MPLYHNQRAEDEADQARLQFADSPDVLGDMGSFYGVNLKGNVNIHDDDDSHKQVANEGVDAIASGNDIYFGEGAYDMGSRDSRGLLAHEAAHVIQQGGLLGMNQNVHHGARQGGKLKNFFRNIGGGLVTGLAALGGAVSGLIWRGWKFKHGDEEETEPDEVPEISDNDINSAGDEKNKKDGKYTLDGALMKGDKSNGFVPLATAHERGDKDMTSFNDPKIEGHGKFGRTINALTSPKIKTKYDYKYGETDKKTGKYNWKDTQRTVFNNASEYMSTLKHTLLASTITGSIIYSIINLSPHYLRMAWPVRIITSVLRHVITLGVGAWQFLKLTVSSIGASGKTSAGERNALLSGIEDERQKRALAKRLDEKEAKKQAWETKKTNAKRWWKKNWGGFFFGALGRKFTNFLNRNKNLDDAGKERANEDMGSIANAVVSINTKPVQQNNNGFDDDANEYAAGSLTHIPESPSMGGKLDDETSPVPDVPSENNEMPSDTEAIDEIKGTEGEDILKQQLMEYADNPEKMPEEMKLKALEQTTPEDISQLTEDEKNQAVDTIVNDGQGEVMLESILPSEEKDKIDNTQEAMKEEQSEGNRDGETGTVTANVLPMPMMPPVAGDSKPDTVGTVTFRNADDAIADGWSERANGYDKLSESFEQVRVNEVAYGSSLFETLRRLQMSVENGQAGQTDNSADYEYALELLNSMDDNSEDNRVAKVWGMRFLKCINYQLEQAA